jgi:hypothetical protein
MFLSTTLSDHTTPRRFCSGDSHEIISEVTEIGFDRMGCILRA